jgi:hypothetical protein
VVGVDVCGGDGVGVSQPEGSCAAAAHKLVALLFVVGVLLVVVSPLVFGKVVMVGLVVLSSKTKLSYTPI